MNFSDEEFQEVCRELDDPNISDYKLLVESLDVKIYRQFSESSGLYEYKVFGTLGGVKPETCTQVYLDLDYRKTWDSYATELYQFTEEATGRDGIYWQVKYPAPLSSRDYVYMRESKELDINGKHVWVILGRSVPFKNQPARSGVVRVDDFHQSLAITADGDNGSKAFMHYYDNPKGMIPKFIINWASQKGVPSFMRSMVDACTRYPAYLEKLAKS